MNTALSHYHRPATSARKHTNSRTGTAQTTSKHLYRADLTQAVPWGSGAVQTELALAREALLDGMRVEVLWPGPGILDHYDGDPAEDLRRLVLTSQQAPLSAELRIMGGPAGLDIRPFLAISACIVAQSKGTAPVTLIQTLLGEEAVLRLHGRALSPARILASCRTLRDSGWSVQLVEGPMGRFPGWRDDWMEAVALAERLVPQLAGSLRRSMNP